MNIEKYTDRARGFVQSAQSLALREGHQQFAPEHLLKVLRPQSIGAGKLVLFGANGFPDNYIKSPTFQQLDSGFQTLFVDFSGCRQNTNGVSFL